MSNVTNATSSAANTQMNPDLQDLHDTLVGMVADLAAQIGTAKDSAAVDAITTEIDEINHRVNLTGNLLFAQQTAGITQAMNDVRSATKKIQTSIDTITSITTFIKDVTSFLQLVDKVIDTAKLVLPGI